ncbi:acetoacetate decarboxylase [Mycolicibacterium madagascariense]|uniref:Acetoacetate decarboxylase n=1 Tax=Mycolicibacterium madagascariense TaxID=212765 RepID=A0A7I7XMQ0_9MYCO|nr:acetoacetate decarboxylase family protein [Mycolicibacterium madagascariense]MCV7013175.1 acetoacetate decarboxylase family protein [Mycolicibacterium madagascariense]BBZ30484.1 acetoacetate decarboxylase [Mycolicibacterium madagascariense]
MTEHTIAGSVVTMPVRVRAATQHMAMFSVDADAAQRLVDYSGLRVCRYRPTKAIVVLMLMEYVDGDLGRYLEYGTNVMVNPPGSDATGLKALQSAGAFIHHLPVDGEFTMAAGRSIWGYPKVLADFAVRDGRRFSFDVGIDGQFAVGMDFRPGLPVPSAFTGKTQVHPTYSHLDGVTRETAGEMRLFGVRYRPGGVRVRLGEHPYARELASLGFPKRAMLSSSADNVEMTFGDAKEIA